MTQVRIAPVTEIFNALDISCCSLMKINIEGGEFEILPKIIESGLIHKVDSLLIQFHEIDRNSLDQMNAIRAGLAQTHECCWEYQWVWEKWVKRAK